MCHLILALPFVSLLLFYFLPFEQALIIYLPIAILSLFIFYKIIKVMQIPTECGKTGMIGLEGEVIEPLNPEGRFRVNNEIWHACSSDRLAEGEKGRIVGFEGMMLVVERGERS